MTPAMTPAITITIKSPRNRKPGAYPMMTINGRPFLSYPFAVKYGLDAQAIERGLRAIVERYEAGQITAVGMQQELGISDCKWRLMMIAIGLRRKHGGMQPSHITLHGYKVRS